MAAGEGARRQQVLVEQVLCGTRDSEHHLAGSVAPYLRYITYLPRIHAPFSRPPLSSLQLICCVSANGASAFENIYAWRPWFSLNGDACGGGELCVLATQQRAHPQPRRPRTDDCHSRRPHARCQRNLELMPQLHPPLGLSPHWLRVETLCERARLALATTLSTRCCRLLPRTRCNTPDRLEQKIARASCSG